MAPLLTTCVGLVLLFSLCPNLRAGVMSTAAQSSGAQSASNGESAAQAQAQRSARRREEIRQKKIDNPEPQDAANIYRHAANVRKVARVLGLSTEVTSRLFEILNFALLLIGIVWLVARILPKTLRTRSERITTEIQQARVATEDANRRLARVEERLSRLDGEIEAIRAQAEQETSVEEKRLRAAIEQEKQVILDAAALDIAAATKNAENLLKNLAADLVIEHAKRQIAVSQATDRSLVENFLTDLDGGKQGKRTGGGVN
ncbi:MAG: ATP synthase F0 subunit B [Acidobacteriaceae bacterium]